MAEPSDSIVEEREEWMVSPFGGGDRAPTLRTAHFLKPSVRSPTEEPVIEFPSLSAAPLMHKLKPNERPLNVHFPGWRVRPKLWLEWLDQLHSTYHSVWKQVGIYEAIVKFRYEIRRNDDVIFGIAERWNPKANTFVFPWGEATITLEDVMVLGGYSVLGESVFCPLGTLKLREVEEKLIQARIEVGRGSCRNASLVAWMKMFKNSGSEIEHEAFLVAWLSGFVLPNTSLVRKLVFPIAVHLANGNRIALAPPVLAAIYRDLSLLRTATMVSAQRLDNFRGGDFISTLVLWSQLHSDREFARWHRVKCGKIHDVRIAVDLAGEKFLWRPYAIRDWAPELYPEKAKWADLGMEEEVHSFARFLRSDPRLLGLDCTELYSPHRVGRQFGLDQDLPGCVLISNKNNTLGSLKLYIPPRLYEAQVTARYLDWWKKSMLGGKKNRTNTPLKLESSPVKMEMDYSDRNNNSDVPPGFPPKSYPKIDIGFPPRNEATESENQSDEPMVDETMTTVFRKNEDVDEGSSSAPAGDGDAFAPQNLVEKASGEMLEMGMEDEGEENRRWVWGDEGIRYVKGVTEMELEARISRLESLDAEIRAARFGNMTNGSCSGS
ncbi:uncharacterized protein LOC111019021 [Momordica charantia]|uniref:Uncharacterized protein LOC111019021 n=1 Tax=Momordica charantia TaxID=3673 RepID=A0A6J1DD84_MOMCH|nr:uncharacterized protein LOC111019021 [Momordica charantia]